jgi:hypothetical protein
MIGIGQENDRFARALSDEFLRKRLMAEYAQRSRMCGWAAILQAGLALALFLKAGKLQAHYVFLCVALGFLIISVRLRRDLNRLKLADLHQLEDDSNP